MTETGHVGDASQRKYVGVMVGFACVPACLRVYRSKMSWAFPMGGRD